MEPSTELPSIPDRVSKGVAWLEEQGAYDWAEKIVGAVEQAAFDMAGCSTCAIGVTLGDYSEHGVFSDGDEPVLLGFEQVAVIRCEDEPYFNDGGADYRALEAEWERRAREHAAYRADVLGT